MGCSRIKYFKSSDLDGLSDELAGVLIRLMFAVNDISLAVDADGFWAETTEQHRAYRKRRARMYFIRLMESHVHEALNIIDEIKESDALRAAVDQCDARTRRISRSWLPSCDPPSAVI